MQAIHSILDKSDSNVGANNQASQHCIRVTKCTYTAAVLLLTSTVAQAADTDVYLNQTSTVFPNVMFSIDTSLSMRRKLLAPPDYSAAQSYTGPFDRGAFYVSVDGRIPEKKSGLSTAPLASMSGCDFAVGTVASPLLRDGFTGIRMAVAFSENANTNYLKKHWTPTTKVHFEFNNANHVKVECQDDSGRHGAASGGGGLYASSAINSLYSNSPANEISWDKFPFVTVYTGNYLNYKASPPADVSITRDALQKRVISDAIKRTPDIMAGLAEQYIKSATNLGGVVSRGLKDNSIRQNQQQLLVALAATGPTVYGTPLAGSMLEVLHYYFGKHRYKNYGNATDLTILNGNKYISPITLACQKSFVIMVTDGYPWRDAEANNIFVSSNRAYPNYRKHIGSNKCSGNCLDEQARYLSRQDASPLPNKYDLDGDGQPDPQTVKVYPIGMEVDQQLLNDVATRAGTESYYASNAKEFEEAFIEILATIKAKTGQSMVTASSSNDRFSKTSNRNYLYYGLFAPSNGQWRGNIKKYRYAYNSNGVAYVTDSDPKDPDITNADGSLIANAKSYWSDGPDGNKPLSGGVVDQIKKRGPWGRNIYGSFLAGNIRVPLLVSEQRMNLKNMQSSEYRAIVGTSGLSKSEEEGVLQYAIGMDVDDQDGDGKTAEQRESIGGIVRTSPVAIQFGGTSDDPDVIIFAVTSDGRLHAFDDKTGEELWAVILREPMENLIGQRDQQSQSMTGWGADGGLTYKIFDYNENGILEGNDKVLLYVSGGNTSTYTYIIDVTNARSNKAQLVRQSKRNTFYRDWEERGMAIARMVPITYRLNNKGGKRYGMVYPNGWDPVAEYRYGESSMGRGISVLNSHNGYPIWQMTYRDNNEMKYAFATEPTVVDLNGDGLSDLIYAVDINAQVWRFNVNHGSSSASTLISGGKLVELGTNTDRNRRRAYKRIDAAVVSTGVDSEVMLAVGTGDRMNPLSETDDDRLYVIHDKTAFSGASPSDVITNSDLYDVTDNIIGQGDDRSKALAQTQLNKKLGWYVKLPQGKQKSISAPLISAGIVNFPVYQVGGAATDPCEDNNLGIGLLYRMNILDGTPVSDHSGDGQRTAADRFTQIRGGGIPGDVGFHVSSDGVKTIVVNRDTFVNNPDANNPNLNDTPEKLFHGDSAGYWFENE